MTELLSPAGDLDKLKIALLYGADAVYLGGPGFGLRTAAGNFTRDEIREAADFAKHRGKKIYVALNAFLHDRDLAGLPEFVSFLDEVGVDAVICSDLGVIRTVRKHASIPIHLSTQASVLNSRSARIWKRLGVKRIVVGREVSIEDAKRIKNEGVEVEMFVHGAMCMSYSGHCVISNYTAGRDSNRGGCIQSCRFGYDLKTEDGKISRSRFMSSKDLRAVGNLPDMVDVGIDSLKIEGRMKSALYIASTTRVYARALRGVQADDYSPESDLAELEKIPHRGYTEGSMRTPAGPDSVYIPDVEEVPGYSMAGIVLAIDEKRKRFALAAKVKLVKGARVEILPFRGKSVAVPIENMSTAVGADISAARPDQIVWLPWRDGVEIGNVCRLDNRSVSSEVA